MIKTATDVDQSKRLAAAGLPQSTSDMVWVETNRIMLEGQEQPFAYEYDLQVKKSEVEEPNVPAWSLSALSELVPFGYRTMVDKNNCVAQWACEPHWMSIHYTELDAVCELVIVLLEKGEIRL